MNLAAAVLKVGSKLAPFKNTKNRRAAAPGNFAGFVWIMCEGVPVAKKKLLNRRLPDLQANYQSQVNPSDKHD
jgi:hypothetical protein